MRLASASSSPNVIVSYWDEPRRAAATARFCGMRAANSASRVVTLTHCAWAGAVEISTSAMPPSVGEAAGVVYRVKRSGAQPGPGGGTMWSSGGCLAASLAGRFGVQEGAAASGSWALFDAAVRGETVADVDVA